MPLEHTPDVKAMLHKATVELEIARQDHAWNVYKAARLLQEPRRQADEDQLQRLTRELQVMRRLLRRGR